MSLWDMSDHPGKLPAFTPNTDKHIEHNRPADGAQNGATNRTPSRTVNTRIVQRDGKLLWVRNDNTISATFSVIPEIDPSTPILIIAKPPYDVYTDILGIAHPI